MSEQEKAPEQAKTEQEDASVASNASAAGASEAEARQRPERIDVPIETKLEQAIDATKQAISLIGVKVGNVEGRIDDDQVLIKLGEITEPEGATLEGRVYESLQFILNKSINKHTLKRTRLRIEAAGYVLRRGDRVDRAAHALARKVVQLRRPVTIGPLAENDLRKFSAQLSRAGGVKVQNVSEHDQNRLVVTPSGGGRKRRRR